MRAPQEPATPRPITAQTLSRALREASLAGADFHGAERVLAAAAVSPKSAALAAVLAEWLDLDPAIAAPKRFRDENRQAMLRLVEACSAHMDPGQMASTWQHFASHSQGWALFETTRGLLASCAAHGVAPPRFDGVDSWQRFLYERLYQYGKDEASQICSLLAATSPPPPDLLEQALLHADLDSFMGMLEACPSLLAHPLLPRAFERFAQEESFEDAAPIPAAKAFARALDLGMDVTGESPEHFPTPELRSLVESRLIAAASARPSFAGNKPRL